MSRIRWESVLSTITRIAWILFFVSLPVTSFPYFPGGVGGRTLVRPLAIYPLLVLMVLLTIPSLFKRPLPRTFIPLIVFAILAFISSIFAFTSDLEAFRGVTPLSRLFRNLITLALGIGFYFTTTLLNKTWDDLSRSLRWLYLGLGAALMWGSLQIPTLIVHFPPYFRFLNSIQRFISTRKLFSTRISGLTFEPKWFAEQICFLLLPWLIASVLTNRSIFAWRWRKITIEWLLLGWAVIVLIFTFSRTGVFILILLSLLGYFLSRHYFHKPLPVHRKPLHRRILETSLIVISLMTILVVVGSQNPYFSRLWRYWTEAKTRNRSYFEFIAVEQRFVYWETALRIFEQDPLLGVGLGNYAFYFDENLPNRPFHVQKEIVRQITPGEGRDRLITPKNLPARLLAETGVMGTAAFISFLLAIIGCSLFLWYSPSAEQRFYGIAALLALVVFGFVVFSFDSFALPNMWVIFGLITAAAHLSDPLIKTEEPGLT